MEPIIWYGYGAVSSLCHGDDATQKNMPRAHDNEGTSRRSLVPLIHKGTFKEYALKNYTDQSLEKCRIYHNMIRRAIDSSRFSPA